MHVYTVTRSEWVNRKIGAVIYMLAGNSYTWKYNTTSSTTHTNLDGHDDDLDTGNMFVSTLVKELKPKHKYQHIYAPFA